LSDNRPLQGRFLENEEKNMAKSKKLAKGKKVEKKQTLTTNPRFV